MSSYQDLTTARATLPDLPTLITNARAAIDATVGVAQLSVTGYRFKKATDWQPAEITLAQQLLDTAPAQTSQLIAQHDIDGWPIELRAFALALIDQLNVIRAALPVPLPAITPAQAIAAIRNKAGTLS